jgi:hypothetical protein
MFSPHLELALTEVEHRFNELSTALASGAPTALLAASAALRQQAVDFSALLQSLGPLDRSDKTLKSRLQGIASGMALQRQSLIRRTVLVEMALNAVVPATRDTTYAKVAGPYGSPAKQSGAFKFLAA